MLRILIWIIVCFLCTLELPHQIEQNITLLNPPNAFDRKEEYIFNRDEFLWMSLSWLPSSNYISRTISTRPEALNCNTISECIDWCSFPFKRSPRPLLNCNRSWPRRSIRMGRLGAAAATTSSLYDSLNIIELSNQQNQQLNPIDNRFHKSYSYWISARWMVFQKNIQSFLELQRNTHNCPA